MDAIEFIKKSTVYKNSSWLKPVMTTILEDTYTPSLLDDLLIQFFNPEISSSIDEAMDFVNSNSVRVSKKRIQKVVSIDKIENVGLLNSNEKINLDSGLNVFYGKNGAGKSTIYTGLCKVLGKEAKQVIPSIYGNKSDSLVEITYVCDGSEQILNWNSQASNADTGIMLFDSQISNVLVEQDQVNEFDLAHLKSEYFVYIRDTIETLEKKLHDLLKQKKEHSEQIKEFLNEKVPFIITGDFSREKVQQHIFNAEQIQELDKFQKNMILLKREESTESIRNIEYAITEIGNILTTFGKLHNEEYTLSYTIDNLTNVNKLISDYNSAKLALDGQTAQAGIIPENWISKTTWSNLFQPVLILLIHSMLRHKVHLIMKHVCIAINRWNPNFQKN